MTIKPKLDTVDFGTQETTPKVQVSSELYDIMYIIGEGKVVGFNQASHKTLYAEALALSKVADEMVNIQKETVKVTQVEVTQIETAQLNIRKALRVHTQKGGDDQAPMVSGEVEFVEVFSFAKQSLLLVSISTFHEERLKQVSTTIHPLEVEKPPLQPRKKQKWSPEDDVDSPVDERDSLRPFRVEEEGEEQGTVDPKKLKKALEPVKLKLAMEWGIYKSESSGQISSKRVAFAMSPVLLLFFTDDDFTALDQWIAKINESSKTRYGQYQERRAELAQFLEEVPSMPIDQWFKVLREVKDIWWAGWDEPGASPAPLDEYQQFASEFQNLVRPTSEEARRKLAQRIRSQPVPPIKWDGSFSAQLLRYTHGITCKSDFDLLEKGRLGLEVEAEAKFNLVEAKEDIRSFFPHSEGYSLRPTINVRRYDNRWEILKDDLGKEISFLKPISHFESDKSIITPDGMYRIGEAFKHENIAEAAARLMEDYSGGQTMLIKVVGHTDTQAGHGHNQVLSEMRAQAGYGLLSVSPSRWVNLFGDKYRSQAWGEDEMRLMLGIILIKYHWRLDDINIHFARGLLHLYKMLTHHPDEQQQLKTLPVKELVKLFMPYCYRPVLDGVELFGYDNPKGDWSVETELGRRTLYYVVYHYMTLLFEHVTERFFKDVALFDKISFHNEETQGLGETSLAFPTTDNVEEGLNRRIELVPMVMTASNPIVEPEELNFGDIRIIIKGSTSGEAGVNLNLSGKVEFNVNKTALLAAGVLLGSQGQDVSVTGSLSESPESYMDQKVLYGDESQKDDAKTYDLGPPLGAVEHGLAAFDANIEAKGGAFIGAKATTGLTAIIEWRRPGNHGASQKTVLPKGLAPTGFRTMPYTYRRNEVTGLMELIETKVPLGLLGASGSSTPAINDFVALGDVGFSVTGMLGVGLEGEFKIGFDTQSKRFQIKLKVAASWGVGFGGGISFSVAINHMFDFVNCIYEQLKDKEFRYTDLFEVIDDNGKKLDVYDLFSAWSWKMLMRGHIFTAIGVYIAGVVLDDAIEALDDYQNTVRDWERAEAKQGNIDQLLQAIHKDNALLASTTPQVKGRLLHQLLKAKQQSEGIQWMGSPGGLVGRIPVSRSDKRLAPAGLLLIEKGVHSRREWQKVLQYAAPVQPDGRISYQAHAPTQPINRVATALQHETYLREQLFDDPKITQQLEALLAKLA